MTNTPDQERTPEPTRRSTLGRVLPIAWLALSATWAVFIFATDQPAWPLTIWIATTVGPLAVGERRGRLGATTHTPAVPRSQGSAN